MMQKNVRRGIAKISYHGLDAKSMNYTLKSTCFSGDFVWALCALSIAHGLLQPGLAVLAMMVAALCSMCKRLCL
jgi:hypothetical protein